MNELEQQAHIMSAWMVAYSAHKAVGQKRKYSGEDYIVHPQDVVEILMEAKENGAYVDADMLAAGYLHDLVEDTGFELDDIEKLFGETVRNHVDGLTNPSKQRPDLNRAARKKMDREAMWKQLSTTQTIKLADMISNGRDIIEQDPKFAVVFMEEFKLMLEGMTADRYLYYKAWGLVKSFEDE